MTVQGDPIPRYLRRLRQDEQGGALFDDSLLLPLEDLHALTRVRMVIHYGVVITGLIPPYLRSTSANCLLC